MNPAAEPTPMEDVQGDGRWMSQHEYFLSEVKEKEPEVLLVGDSLLLHLSHSQIWGKMFEPLHCLNLSIGGDQTQHVLWRIQNGELENVQPKVIVLLVGTNNYGHTAEQVAMAIKKIAEVIVEKQPQTQIIVMGLPPRGQKPNKLREKIKEINKRLSESFDEMPTVTYVNIDPSIFINPKDETISIRHMYDFLHFTDDGYDKLCEPLLDEIQNLLLSFVKVD